MSATTHEDEQVRARHGVLRGTRIAVGMLTWPRYAVSAPIAAGDAASGPQHR